MAKTELVFQTDAFPTQNTNGSLNGAHPEYEGISSLWEHATSLFTQNQQMVSICGMYIGR